MIVLILLTIALVEALLLSLLVILFFKKGIKQILDHIIAAPIGAVWQRYIHFACCIAGVASGLRGRDVEACSTTAHDSAPLIEKISLTFFHTALETLEGLAWALLLFFCIALLAHVVIRLFSPAKSNPKSTPADENTPAKQA